MTFTQRMLLASAGSALLAFGAPAALTQDADAPCSCSDLNNILNRLVTVRNAFQLFTIAYVNTPENELFSNARFGAISDDIGRQLQTEFDPYPRNYPGADSAFTSALCRVSVPPNVPPCIAQSLRLHEQVHAEACSGRPDWHNTEPLRQALFEEMAAYQKERAFLTEQRRKLECTCPYYALHVANRTNISLALGPMVVQGQNTLQSGPDYLEIPLRLHDDGSISGEGQGILLGRAETTAPGAACEAAGSQSLQVTATGMIDGARGATQLHVQLGSVQPPAGTVSAVCQAGGRTIESGAATRGQNNAFPLEMPAQVGQTQTESFEIVPGIDATLGVEIVETALKAAMTQAEVWNGQNPAPHYLPNCSAAAAAP